MDVVKLMGTIMLTICIQWTLYGNISSFYPPYRLEHHPTLTDTMVGLVLSFFELSMLICSPIVSVFMGKIGRKNCITIGNSMILLASIGFGLLVHVKDDMTFFIFSLLMRII